MPKCTWTSLDTCLPGKSAPLFLVWDLLSSALTKCVQQALPGSCERCVWAGFGKLGDSGINEAAEKCKCPDADSKQLYRVYARLSPLLFYANLINSSEFVSLGSDYFPLQCNALSTTWFSTASVLIIYRDKNWC